MNKTINSLIMAMIIINLVIGPLFFNVTVFRIIAGFGVGYVIRGCLNE